MDKEEARQEKQQLIKELTELHGIPAEKAESIIEWMTVTELGKMFNFRR